MSNRVVSIGLFVFLAGAGLALTRLPERRTHDLDSYTDQQLRQDLIAELDDIDFPLDEQESLKDLHTAIIEALSDDGDDASEDDIDFEDLVDEMEEDGTTVEAVVDEALARADELAMGNRGPDGALSWSNAAQAATPLILPVSYSAILQSRNVRRGFTTTRVAIAQTTNLLVADIRKTR